MKERYEEVNIIGIKSKSNDRVNITFSGLGIRKFRPVYYELRHLGDYRRFTVKCIIDRTVTKQFFAGYAIMQLPGGWLADRFGAKVLIASVVLWSILLD